MSGIFFISNVVRSRRDLGRSGGSSVLSGVCFFMPTFNKSGVTSVVTMTMRTMAGNIFSLTSPDCAPFCRNDKGDLAS